MMFTNVNACLYDFYMYYADKQRYNYILIVYLVFVFCTLD